MAQPTEYLLNGTLNLLMMEGEHLKNKDLFNKMDPYVKIKFRDEKYKTEPHLKGGTDPSWNEIIKIPFNDVKLTEEIHFLLYDKERTRDNKIGRADITLGRLADMCKDSLCELLLETFSFFDKEKPAGVLRFKVAFEGSGWPAGLASTMERDNKEIYPRVEPVALPSLTPTPLPPPTRAYIPPALPPKTLPTEPQRFGDVGRCQAIDGDNVGSMPHALASVQGFPKAYEQWVGPEHPPQQTQLLPDKQIGRDTMLPPKEKMVDYSYDKTHQATPFCQAIDGHNVGSMPHALASVQGFPKAYEQWVGPEHPPQQTQLLPDNQIGRDTILPHKEKMVDYSYDQTHQATPLNTKMGTYSEVDVARKGLPSLKSLLKETDAEIAHRRKIEEVNARNPTKIV